VTSVRRSYVEVGSCSYRSLFYMYMRWTWVQILRTEELGHQEVWCLWPLVTPFQLCIVARHWCLG